MAGAGRTMDENPMITALLFVWAVLATVGFVLASVGLWLMVKDHSNIVRRVLAKTRDRITDPEALAVLDDTIDRLDQR